MTWKGSTSSCPSFLYIYSISMSALLWNCAWLGEALNFCLFAITNSATNLSFLIWLTVKGGVSAFLFSLSRRTIACPCFAICISSSSGTASFSLFAGVAERPVSLRPLFRVALRFKAQAVDPTPAEVSFRSGVWLALYLILNSVLYLNLMLCTSDAENPQCLMTAQLTESHDDNLAYRYI